MFAKTSKPIDTQNMIELYSNLLFLRFQSRTSHITGHTQIANTISQNSTGNVYSIAFKIVSDRSSSYTTGHLPSIVLTRIAYINSIVLVNTGIALIVVWLNSRIRNQVSVVDLIPSVPSFSVDIRFQIFLYHYEAFFYTIPRNCPEM